MIHGHVRPRVARQVVLYSAALLLAFGPRPAAAQAMPGDANGDAHVNVSDVFYLINFLFAGGPAPVPSELTVFLPGNVPLVMVRIPSGTFQMGSPETERGRGSDEVLHQVTLTKDYHIGKYEVTQAQWQAVMGSNPAATGPCGDYGIGESHPVYCVSWDDIKSFVSELIAYFISEGYPAAWAVEFRLPTEAEWERAARAGTQTRFPFGDALSCNDSCAACRDPERNLWWCANSGGKTHAVGQRQPNGLGLHDVAGNVLEWVNDWYGVYPEAPQVDPHGPLAGSSRVLRGGGRGDYLMNCRPAFRASYGPGNRSSLIGFRLAHSG